LGVFDRAVATVLPAVPRSLVRRVSAPYIAGPTLDDARSTVVALNAAGKRATVDVLGEEVHNAAEAEAIAAAYRDVLAAIATDGLDANISVKLTGLGLKIDLDLCRSLLSSLVRDAGTRGSFVRIDMEDASCVDDTLALYRTLRDAGLDNVGIVLQAHLKRTLTDIAELRDLRPSVRLCKGIYIEPSTISFKDPDVIRRSFVSCLDTLLDEGSRVAIATHDEQLIGESLVRIAALPPAGYEFQMLLGVRESRADELVAAGHPLRVYVPFGQRWYEYSLRRLQENPQMAGAIAKATLARAVGRG
jgi:proline dehydrogenase